MKEDEVDGLQRQVYRVKIDGSYEAPICIIAPPGSASHPAVLVFHGGDGGLDVCCGPGLGRFGVEHYHHDMSLELSKAGFVTITVSIRAAGREARDWGLGDCGKGREALDDLVGYSIFRGSCAMGVWTHDAISILDAIIGDPRIDPERVGVAGISTGGEISLYLGAMEETISEFNRIRDAYSGSDATAQLHITPGGGHSFDTPAAVEFLNTHLV